MYRGVRVCFDARISRSAHAPRNRTPPRSQCTYIFTETSRGVGPEVTQYFLTSTHVPVWQAGAETGKLGRRRAPSDARQRPSNMAENGSLVTVSGAALSLLLYENVRSPGDQIGFLLGEVVVFVTKKVTDSDRQVEHVKTHVDITTITTCPTSWFCNGTGRVDKERLKYFIGNKSKQIVGWFRFRKNESLVPTLQDKLLHKELCSTFFGSCGDTQDHQYFTMCLLNTSVSNRGGTHKFRHVFLQYKNGVFEPIQLRINNLGADSSRPDGSDYKPKPLQKSISEPDEFTKIVDSLNLNPSKMPGIELVTRIQKVAERHLDSMISKLSASDRGVESLEQQVRKLQSKINARKLMTQLGNQEPTSPNEKLVEPGEREVSKIKLTNELIDELNIFNESSSLVKNQSTIQRQVPNKQRNLGIQTQKNVSLAPKSVNQDMARVKLEVESPKTNTSSVHDPFESVVANVKMEMRENTPNRERRSKEASSSPEIVAMTHSDSHSTGSIGRGYGGFGSRSEPADSNFGSKKARRGRGRSTSEKFSMSTTSTEQDNKPKVATKLEFSPTTPVSYSQAARRSTGDVTPVRNNSDSQEY